MPKKTDGLETSCGACIVLMQKQEWPDPQTSHDLMAYELDYYIRHHDVVLKKLRHAQEATMQSLREVEDICKRFAIDSTIKEFNEIEKYKDTWEQIMDLFGHAGLSEQELSRIESMLVSIPDAIRKNYEALVRQDRTLLTLIEKLDSEEYREVCRAIYEVQQQTNPMSGLGPEHYELDAPVDRRSPVPVMRITPQKRSKSRHH